jgi:nucleotide-binding universal stress UspA family protein
LATSLAKLEQSELHVIHAWDLRSEGILRGAILAMSKKEVDRLVRQTRKMHKEWLDGLLEAYALGNVKHQVHLLKGEAGELISALAKKKRAELIVMGTVSRTGIRGFFIGNTAEKVLSQVGCSVLTVKPDRFITPVRMKG